MSAKITKGGKDYPLWMLPQNIISKVLNMYKWTYLSEVSDHNVVSIPSGAREVFAVGNYGNMSALFPISVVGNVRSGYYNTNTDNGDFYMSYQNGELTVTTYKINGTDRVGNGVRIYYR